MKRTIEESREFFAQDRFATKRAGIEINDAIQGADGHGVMARCSMAITPDHLNVGGTVMGGAIFTLADFCFAVLTNAWDEVSSTVTVSASIRFVGVAKGTRLTGTAETDKSGRTLIHAHCRVEDELGNLVALCDATFMRIRQSAK